MYAKPVKQNEILFEFYHNDIPSNFSSEIRQNKIQEASLDRKYTKPGLQSEKKSRAHHKFKKNNCSNDALSG